MAVSVILLVFNAMFFSAALVRIHQMDEPSATLVTIAVVNGALTFALAAALIWRGRMP